MNPLHTGCCSFGRGSAVAGRLVTVVLAGLGLVASTATADPLWWDEIGGDDVPAVMADVYELASPVMDIAENGDIYIAAPTGTAGSTSLVVFRSTDGGDTWPEWGRLDSLGVTYSDVSIRVAEGIVSRLYLAYTIEAAAGGRQEIHVAWSPLGGASASWSYRVVLTGAAEVFSGPCLDSDEANINGFRLYLAAEGDDGNGHDIWFTRSLNYGDSWETPYEIASLATGDHYRGPSVAYGWGGVVHAAWTYDPVASPTRDSAVRYRRAMNYAGNGIADWQATVYLTSNTNGITESSPIVAPSLGGNDVLLSCSYNAGGPDWGVSLYRSEDVGATWPATPGADEMAYHMEPLSLPGTAGFTFRSDAGVVHPGLQSSTGAAPLALSQFKNVADRWCDPTHYFSVHDRQDYNMARGNRRGVIWMSEGVAAPDTIWFDAEWRTDPGLSERRAPLPAGADQRHRLAAGDLRAGRRSRIGDRLRRRRRAVARLQPRRQPASRLADRHRRLCLGRHDRRREHHRKQRQRGGGRQQHRAGLRLDGRRSAAARLAEGPGHQRARLRGYQRHLHAATAGGGGERHEGLPGQR